MAGIIEPALEQVECLKNVADAPRAQPIAAWLAQRGHLFPRQQNASLVWLEDSRDEIQKSGFPGTALPAQRHLHSILQREVQDLDHPARRAIRSAEVLHEV